MNIEKINPCHVKRAKSKELAFPAKVFGYLALCAHLKHKVKEVQQVESIPVYGGLPFVSSMTSKFSPKSAVYAHWSFLKY